MELEYARRWIVGGQEFTNKAEAQKYRASMSLSAYSTADELIANADRVIELLRPFATPKRRKTAKNGQTDAPASARARKGGDAAQASA